MKGNEMKIIFNGETKFGTSPLLHIQPQNLVYH